MDDDTVSNFTAISGASVEVARHYLQLTDYNMEQAIQLFFDSPELASMAGNAPPVPPQSSRPPRMTGTADSSGVIHIDSDDDNAMDEDSNTGDGPAVAPPVTASNAAYEDDEAMARRMQEELYSGGEHGGGLGTDNVRAPIGRTTETLVGPGADWAAPDDMHDTVLEQLRRRAGPRSGRVGVFNQQAGSSSSSIWDGSANPDLRRAGLAEATGGASEANSKAAKLAELFRPPFELMSQLPWDDARQEGKDDQKWILVNIQDPSIFDCQALNRDIWKHEGVKETVKENFIFIQYAKDDPRGGQYINYYFPLRDSEDAYPHIAIVDPRTGEQVKIWSGRPVPKAMDFLMQLHEFLDRYSLDTSVKNPVAKRKPEKAPSMDVDRMTEEQQLEMALQHSLANGSVEGPKAHDPDDLTKSIGDLADSKGKGKESDAGANDEETIPSVVTPFSTISSNNTHQEPKPGSVNTTRIQFRHSNGRIIRVFDVSNPVRRIYEWLKAEPLDGRQGVDFELKMMGKDLISSLDESIADAGLKNATVMIEYIED